MAFVFSIGSDHIVALSCYYFFNLLSHEFSRLVG